MRSVLIDHSGVIARRIACVLAAALLACASSAQAQVIEEGGFPVKEDGLSGESFSLSCPPRLVAHAGESVLLSCSATGVPEEGVHYSWESVPSEGLRLLSDANERSPLFTAPSSAAGAEYTYRLTAMAAGVYRAATVTVSVEGASGEPVRAPGLQEECDPITIPDEPGQGCASWEREPDTFGFGPESEGEFLFPEAPDRPSGPVRGGGFDSQTPPRLECPVAVFLEELETGAIECHVWDASGEEYLEYSWEPVGNTTRDYLDNPRLIPEDSPTPSVIAPEAPVYETLESFHSGETTFRYRYRLTAVSRATGLSSSSEVEVYVSSSRPSVYCPLEIVVEEGETVTLDCEGADPLSSRMGYDEEAASVLWEWEGLWGTSTAPLDAADLSSPLFTAPAGSAGEEYHYIASMTTSASGAPRTARRRITVRVAGEEEAGRASAPASKGNAPSVTCNDAEIFEAAEDFALDCSVTDEPDGATYAWKARGSTSGTSELSSTTVLTPTFSVPDDISRGDYRDYTYTVRFSASGIADITEDVKVRVLEKPNLSCTLYTPLNRLKVDEGSSDIVLKFCAASIRWSLHPRFGPHNIVTISIPNLRFEWTARAGTPDTRLLSATNREVPRFFVPDDVTGDMTYYYLMKVSYNNADPYWVYADVTVRDRDPFITCVDTEVYEGAADITLDCTAKNKPSGATYSWAARGSTSDTNDLSSTTVLTPTFNVPGSVNTDTDYDYRVTLSASGIADVTEDVTVTVLNKAALSVVCSDPGSAYEGSEDIAFDCSASGTPSGSDYTYAWTPRGDTQDTSLLSASDIASPTFAVPDEVAATMTYQYLLAVSAANAEDGSAEVTVTVLNKGSLAVVCSDPGSAYEGSEDILFDCSASGAPGDSPQYMYVWTARGDTPDVSLLSASDIASPAFAVPDVLDETTTYEYLLTARAENSEDGAAEVTVTVLNKGSLAVVCAAPGSVYEGSDDIAFDCEASGAPAGSAYEYVWRPRGDTPDTALLSATDIASPTFYVPNEVAATTTYQYLLTVSAANVESATARVTVTVLNKEALTAVCSDPGSAYEGSEAIAFDCSASGAPSGSDYTYVWTPRGDTPDTALLSATDIASPTFYVPNEVAATTTYQYLLTVSAANVESATARVTVTVLNKEALTAVCSDPGSAYEGSEAIAFDCSASGAPSGSDYTYVWTPRGDTQDTALLSATDIVSPVFFVPDEVDATTTYGYLLTVSAANTESATARVTVTVLNKEALAVVCLDPGSVYEGSADIAFDCEASGTPAGSTYEYVWTPRGDTQDTSLLSTVDIASPTFSVPEEVDATTTYEYLLTVSAENAEDGTAEVTVTVLNHGPLAVVCADPGSVYEGSEDVVFDCEASGAPGDSPGYTYVWAARGDTPDVSLLSAADIASPTFLVSDEVGEDETYEYRLTVSAANAEDGTAEVSVTVLNKEALAVACADPGSVYEGSEDITFDCSASGAPEGSSYTYAWTARGDTPDTALLSATDIVSPVFFVPDEVDATTTYGYLLTVSAANTESATARVTVTVLNKEALAVVCLDPGSVYEGSADIAFDCEASGTPAGSTYEYVWTPRGDTQDTSLLSTVDIASPAFSVPEEVDATTTYEYRLTVSAENAEDGTAEVTVTVLNKEALAVTCAAPGPVYEGSEDIAFDCEASGAPGENPEYTYVWTARGDTPDVSLLSAADIALPTFYVPDEVDATTTYEYRLTVSAENAEDGTAEVTVTVLNKEALAVTCAAPGPVYEGSEDIAFDCEASGAPGKNPEYTYVWTAWGNTPDTALLSASDIASPTFLVSDKVGEDETYEYRLTVSAANAEDGTAEVSVTVLNKEALAVACADPGSVYEGSEDITFDCSASGAPEGSSYTYAWTARGDTPDTALLSATDIASLAFYVPNEVDATTTYEYFLTVSAENAEDASAEIAVTVLNKEALAVVCVNPGSVYEGSEDITFDCSASGAPGDSPEYTYSWTARGDTQDTSLLSAVDIASPVFYVPDEVDATTTYEYLLTVSAENAEEGTAEVTVTVLDRIQTPDPEPVSSALASSSARELSESSSLGVTVSASLLRFGVQSADTQVSLDPVTDGISTHVSGPYHAGRMTLAPGGEALDENREMDLSIELTSPVLLKRADAVETSSLVLEPAWSLAESCEQLSSQAIGGLYMEVTLSEEACRLLRFGGELDLTDVPSGRYAGNMDIILRSGEREETFAVEVSVTVVPAQRVITIGPGGVRFSTSRELPVSLTEEQNLSIYPDVAFLTEEQPHGVFELSNPSLIPLEVSVSARFGYTEATANGREVVVEDVSASRLSDLSEVVDIHPNVLVLQPGEKGLVRYGVKEEAHAEMAQKGYAAFFDVVSAPRQYVALDRMPEGVTGDRTARVTMRVPGVYVPGEGASQLRAALLSISYVGSLSATFLLETADHPFVGEVVAYDGDGRELGRREALVYTRSRVRVPLDGTPDEETVFLRFVPRGSDRAPLPTSVEWNAPRRDIGDAEDKDRATIPTTLVQKQ